MQTCRTNRSFSSTGGSRRPLFNEPGRSRMCLHVLTGRVDAPKVCTRQFECYHCGFDQLLDVMDTNGMAWVNESARGGAS